MKMTHLEQFKAMLDSCNTCYDVCNEPLRDGGAVNAEMIAEGACVVRVMGGYQAHFEAEFDKDGNLLSMGQWEYM
jgi:hypothetical protein